MHNLIILFINKEIYFRKRQRKKNIRKKKSNRRMKYPKMPSKIKLIILMMKMMIVRKKRKYMMKNLWKRRYLMMDLIRLNKMKQRRLKHVSFVWTKLLIQELCHVAISSVQNVLKHNLHIKKYAQHVEMCAE